MKNMWKTAIMGVVVGDALGCPVQFLSREEVAQKPVTGMIGHGTFDLPAGSWTDDSSLTLALAESIRLTGRIDYIDIMDNFVAWLEHGEFTPYGFSYDIGNGTMRAIEKYARTGDPYSCGGISPNNNGNGSLMRIMPAVLYCIAKKLPDDEAIKIVHGVSGLTHAHIRAKIACGLYYFMTKAVVNGHWLQVGIDNGFHYYESRLSVHHEYEELRYFNRLRNLHEFALTPVDEISSSGYVVDTLEAAVWSIFNEPTFKGALLTAVNLGRDTDSVAAVAGGLAALIHGYDSIPAEWLEAIKRRDWIERLIEPLDEMF